MTDLDKRASGYLEAVSARQNGVAPDEGFNVSGSRETFIAEINFKGTRTHRIFFNRLINRASIVSGLN
ncbi:hypothetical protein ASF84_06520 [Pseudomonas sp. Leaf127]|uniref:hypothetical protein n=1 Tax=Pseudomonas sp. Leaf127 TaxID=1736267 RepID=UPI000702636A|nr:hypothetical protein [Pseudomonas sp. Leaf127]KQQ56821.1 hypothetical protein ASF84_06520 [Pseudomonas sp. Leaf127]